MNVVLEGEGKGVGGERIMELGVIGEDGVEGGVVWGGEWDEVMWVGDNRGREVGGERREVEVGREEIV